MVAKTLKFREHLVPLVLSGEKDTTWRLFDDKNLTVGDKVEMVNSNTGEKFAEVELLSVKIKILGELQPTDFTGHEKFASNEEMYDTYRRYYGDRVGPDTEVKIIGFKLL